MWPCRSSEVRRPSLFLISGPAPGSSSDILCSAATLSKDRALKAAMLLAKPEPLPDLRTTALDEILAIGLVVDHELDDLAVAVLIAIAPSVLLDEAIDRRLDLKQPRSLATLDPMHDLGLPA